jgi:hypothetical protein
MLAKIVVDNESKGIVRRFLASHLGVYEKLSQKFVDSASRYTSDFTNKANKGAARAAVAAARVLPAAARHPWLLDLDNRVAVWRLLATTRKGALRQCAAEDEGHDFALHEHRSLRVAAFGILEQDVCAVPGYAMVTQHALGRLCQRGGARTENAIREAVLALHDDIGRMPIATAEKLLSRSEGETFWFPAKNGAWALDTLRVSTESNYGETMDYLVAARTWLSHDELDDEKAREADGIRAGLLRGIGDPNAAASTDGPLSTFREIQIAGGRQSLVSIRHEGQR